MVNPKLINVQEVRGGQAGDARGRPPGVVRLSTWHQGRLRGARLRGARRTHSRRACACAARGLDPSAAENGAANDENKVHTCVKAPATFSPPSAADHGAGWHRAPHQDGAGALRVFGSGGGAGRLVPATQSNPSYLLRLLCSRLFFCLLPLVF